MGETPTGSRTRSTSAICPRQDGSRSSVRTEWAADLVFKSYAFKGQIDDLARMPELATQALTWLRLDRERVYALGSSMGGQETLMLVARHPELLAGAAAMDSVTDLTRRYHQLPGVPCDAKCLKRWGKPYGLVLQAAMREEVGGAPSDSLKRYAARSASAYARTIASSGVRSRSGGAAGT